MKGISDINIIGIDKTRPPVIRKEPYIDVFFELSHQAPIDWCKDLNTLFSQNKPENNATIDAKEGLFINTWVRTAEEISSLFEQLKDDINACTDQYISNIQLTSNQSGTDANETNISDEQENLNKIIAALVFV